MTIAIVLGPVALVFAVAVAIFALIQPSSYSTEAEYDQALSDMTSMLQGGIALAWFAAYAVMARKVSFRWFDAFCLMVPIYGWVWQFRIAHRLAYLPNRDWAPRPDEVARGQAPAYYPGGFDPALAAPPRRTYGAS